MKKLLLLLSMLSTLLSAQDVFLIGYVPPYRVQSLDKMDISGLTHVIAAFANPDSSGTMSCPIDLSAFVQKVKDGGSSPVISIGGGGSYSWGADTTIYEHLYADSNRTMFVNKLVVYAKEYGVSGIDVDIEGTPLMHELYDPFVRELADSLHANDLEIYSAFGVGAFAGAGYVDDETLLKFDIIGTMSYGGVGNWNWQKQEDQATLDRFKADVQYFIDRGVDPSKIAGGIPFYSVGYPNEAKESYSDYFHTLDQLYNDEFYKSQNPFYNDTLVNAEGNPEYCNGFLTMKKKIDHMHKFKGGIMIWELGQDNYNSGPNMLDSMIYYIETVDSGSNDTDTGSVDDSYVDTDRYDGFKVVSYFPVNGTIEDMNEVDFTKITHMIAAFIQSDIDGNLKFPGWKYDPDKTAQEAEEEMLDSLIAKSKRNGVAPMIALGTTYDGWQMTKSATARTNFVKNIKAFIKEKELLGLDLDLEGWVDNSSSPFYPEEYALLAQEIHDSLGDDYILTSAVSANKKGIPNWTDDFISVLDWVNIMVYDIRVWNGSDIANQSLFQDQVDAATYWLDRGLTKKQLCFGVPFYSRGWDYDNGKAYVVDVCWSPDHQADSSTWNWSQQSTFSYEFMLDKFDMAAEADSILLTPLDTMWKEDGWTGYKGTYNGVLYYNGPDMIKKKSAWAQDSGFGGMMIWELTGDIATDEPLSLLGAMANTLEAGVSIKSSSNNMESTKSLIIKEGRKLVLHLQSGVHTISLVDVKGRVVHQFSKSKAMQGRIELDINTLSLAKGIYFLTVETNKNSIKQIKMVL